MNRYTDTMLGIKTKQNQKNPNGTGIPESSFPGQNQARIKVRKK